MDQLVMWRSADPKVVKAAAGGVIAAVLAFAMFLPSALALRDFTGDEASKISESYYFRRHPDWFISNIERTNPPVGKWLFGAVLYVAGQDVPADPALSWRAAEGRYVPPPGREEAYRRALRPLRVFSVVMTAILFGVVVWMSVSCGGMLAGWIAFVLLWRHVLTQTLAPLATFDALQVMPMTAAVALLLRQRRLEFRAAVAGLLIALAFQTRLNGILAMAPALVAIGLRKRAALVLFAVCAVASIAINPYYWVSGPNAGIIHRIVWQMEDVSAVMATLNPNDISDTPGEKARFFLTTVASGVAGKAIIAGAIIAVFLCRRESAIALTAALVFAAWLPIMWPRYVYPAIPLLVWLASLGFSAAATAATESIRRRSVPRRSAGPASHPESLL